MGSIKKAAKQQLSGNYIVSITCYFLIWLITLAPIIISCIVYSQANGGLISTIIKLVDTITTDMTIFIFYIILIIIITINIQILIFSPFLASRSTIAIKIKREQYFKLSDVFTGYKYYFKSVVLNYIRTFSIMLFSIFLIAPGVMIGYSYCLSPFLIAENPSMGAIEALSTSKKLMRGRRLELFISELPSLLMYLIPIIILIISAFLTKNSLESLFREDQLMNTKTFYALLTFFYSSFFIIFSIFNSWLSVYNNVVRSNLYDKLCNNKK